MPVKPVYIELYEKGEFDARIEKFYEILENCRLCPRHCNVNRKSGEKGFCRSGFEAVVSSVYPHFGEEPELVGKNGSGTIFFCSCNLGCIYCQNYEISHLGAGKKFSTQELASSMLYLQKQGCHNINFVTPTHYTPQIVLAMKFAIEKGLQIPVVYNCSGYEDLETIKLLDGIIDIYMPDIKYSNGKYAKLFSFAEDYFEKCKESVKEMHRQAGDLKTENGMAYKGLLLRHLVLPEDVAGSELILKFIHEEISPQSHINIMAQYRPLFKAKKYKEISRMCTLQEFERVVITAKKYGFKIF